MLTKSLCSPEYCLGRPRALSWVPALMEGVGGSDGEPIYTRCWGRDRAVCPPGKQLHPSTKKLLALFGVLTAASVSNPLSSKKQNSPKDWEAQKKQGPWRHKQTAAAYKATTTHLPLGTCSPHTSQARKGCPWPATSIAIQTESTASLPSQRSVGSPYAGDRLKADEPLSLSFLPKPLIVLIKTLTKNG